MTSFFAITFPVIAWKDLNLYFKLCNYAIVFSEYFVEGSGHKAKMREKKENPQEKKG